MGVVISESAAEKLRAYKVEKTMFSVNSNDVLINLYGDQYYYKSFPKVGDEVTNKVLTAIRRIQHDRILYDFQSDKLREIDALDDTVIYTRGGEIVDVNIFSNVPLNVLKDKKDEFSQELFLVYEEQVVYYQTLVAELEKIIPVKILTEDEEKKERQKYGISIKHPVNSDENPNKYTEELAYYWKMSHEQVNEKIQWRHEGKTFDSFKIQFTIVKESPVTLGTKITGRLTLTIVSVS